MEWTNARLLEQAIWFLRLSDYPRSLNRALIDGLANGQPPYSQEAEPERAVNVNDLSLTRLSHDARMQLTQAFTKPGNFFTCRTDSGSQAKREARGVRVTRKINRFMRDSDAYFECMRSKFALMVLHGVGPSNWENQDRWCPIALGMGDVLLPSNTVLSFRNLPFFALYRDYTAMELQKLIRHPDRNPGWNIPVVKRAMEWADEQTMKLYSGTTWAEYWVPEKRQERFKQDSGVYSSGLVQTIGCYDFYYWSDARKQEGWRRKIIFDAYGGYGGWGGPMGYGAKNQMPEKNLLDDKGLLIYSSGDRVVADKLSNLVHFQFADLSSVAPFHYHSVRSLGFLLYAVCHLQNRLRCAFSESVFENLMMYMRVRSLDDAERSLKIVLKNRGIIDDSVEFLNPDQRWQPNAQLAELGMNEFKQIIADNSSSYVQNQNFSRDRVEKTKFQVLAEVNAMQTLISAALQQAYRYQTSEYREIVRRFFKKNSTDPDVREFRAYCLTHDIPEKMLDADAWDVEAERILGAGNKTLEMAVAQLLMEMRAAYSPEAQQKILKKFTLAVTDNADDADALVPDQPTLSDAKHDAMLAFGSLMVGGEVQWESSLNRIDIATTLIGELSLAVNRALQMGGMVSPQELAGMKNVLVHISELVDEIGKDKPQAELAKKLAQASGKLANEVNGFESRLMQQMKAQNGNGGMDAKAISDIQNDRLKAEAKAANTRESHADRSAQRLAQEEEHRQQRAEDHALEQRLKVQEAETKAAALDIETAAKIRTQNALAKSAKKTDIDEQ